MASIINTLREIASCHGIAMLEMSSGKRLFGFPQSGIETDDEAVDLYSAGPTNDDTETITVRMSSVDAVYWVDHNRVTEDRSRANCNVHKNIPSSANSTDCACKLRQGLFGAS